MREEILQMEPGREMDIKIAVEIFGLEVDGDICEDQDFPQWNGDFLHIVSDEVPKPPLKHYSTEISAAWELVEKKRLTVHPTYDGYEVVYCNASGSGEKNWVGTTNGIKWIFGKTAPEAICKAALLAKE